MIREIITVRSFEDVVLERGTLIRDHGLKPMELRIDTLSVIVGEFQGVGMFGVYDRALNVVSTLYSFFWRKPKKNEH